MATKTIILPIPDGCTAYTIFKNGDYLTYQELDSVKVDCVFETEIHVLVDENDMATYSIKNRTPNNLPNQKGKQNGNF